MEDERLHVFDQTRLEKGGKLGFADVFVACVEHGGEKLEFFDKDWNGDFVEGRHF